MGIRFICINLFTFKKEWFIGEITNIYIDDITRKEWFIVKYNRNKKINTRW